MEDKEVEIKVETTVETVQAAETQAPIEGRKRFDRREFKPRRTGDKRDFRRDKNNNFQSDLQLHLVSLRAVSKTRAGGRQRSFSVLIVAGNEKGLVGCGTGKSADIVEAIKKAERRAKNNLVRVVLRKTTIAHNVKSYFCGTSVIIRKVPEGTGLKAGGVARKVLLLAGIKDISCKCIGNSMSNHNMVYAIIDALSQTMKITEISQSLGKTVKEILERSRA